MRLSANPRVFVPPPLIVLVGLVVGLWIDRRLTTC